MEIDLNIVWETIVKNIPPLRKKINSLLKSD